MDEDITYFKGTHRVIAPEKTIENNESKLKSIGVTRVADITDLDRIGIPVYTAIRPTAQDGAISIYGGKGITKNHAKASAIMEAFERYSAERQDCDNYIIRNFQEIECEGNSLNPKLLVLPKEFDKEDISEIPLEWSLGKEIMENKNIYIPSNAIFHPYIANPNVKTLFKSNTNGLASGNTLDEAVLHGAFEVIERDAWSLFELTHKNYSQINTETIESEIIQDLLLKFNSQGIKIKLMNLTRDVKIPTIAASADDTLTKDAGLLTLGIGTHLNPEIATIRSLCEVAQSRATQINGAREDTVRADFTREIGYERMKRINKYYFREEDEKINLSDIEDKSTKSIKKDLEVVKEEIKNNNLENIIYYDLTRPETDVNVVRVIIPEMEIYALDQTRAGFRFLKA